MKTINNVLIPSETETRNTLPAETANYAAMRFNALKHGVLSRHVVLPHEDRQEYDELRDALLLEHRPTGATELHLVEELAGILWRKRRILMAEGAQINEGLRSAASSPERIMPSSVPFEYGLTGKNVDFRDLLNASPAEIAERQRTAELDLAATRKAAVILRKGGDNAYEKARRALIPESRNWWDSLVEDEEYPETSEGLVQFIHATLEPICLQMQQEARFQPEIKQQAIGESLQMHRLEKLNRYETHLDRKFERTLAMLLKMKELRRE